MLKDITLGQYFPGNTPAHRLDPRTKILLVVLYIVALFCAKSVLTYGLVALMLFCSGLLGIVIYAFHDEWSYTKDVGFVVSNSFGGASLDWVMRYDKEPIDSEAIAELNALEHVKEIHIAREMNILAELDTVPRYAMHFYVSNNFGMLDDNMFQEAMELRSDRNAHESDRQQDRTEYFRLREKYGFILKSN